MSLPSHVERPVAVGTVAVDREVLVEGRDAPDPEALHHGEAGAVDDREVLVGKDLADLPGGVEVNGEDGLDRGKTIPEGAPEALGVGITAANADEAPALDEHMVGCDQVLHTRQDGARPRMVHVAAVECRVECRAIDEQAQRSDWPVSRRCSCQSASPMYSCLYLAMFDPPESNRPQIALMSRLGAAPLVLLPAFLRSRLSLRSRSLVAMPQILAPATPGKAQA
jgi:hypothetical protein